MYECILPSTNKRVGVRGLTLKEEIELQSSFFLLDTTFYTMFLNLARICRETSFDLNNIPFEEWLNNITEADLHALCFALYYDTFGNQLKITTTCGNDNMDNEVIVNLDKIHVDTSLNTNLENVFEVQDVEIKEGLVIKKHKYFTIGDKLCVFLVNNSTINNINQLTTKESLLVSRLSSIVGIEVKNVLFTRPSPLVSVEKMKEWFQLLEDHLSFIPSREYRKKIDTHDSPYSLTFTTSFKCKKCKKESKVELNFFRYLLEGLSS